MEKLDIWAWDPDGDNAAIAYLREHDEAKKKRHQKAEERRQKAEKQRQQTTQK